MATRKSAAPQGAADATEDAPASPPAGSDVLRVRAVPPEGFRRAGRFWPGDVAVEVPVGELSAAQLAALLAEPLLAVTVLAAAAQP